MVLLCPQMYLHIVMGLINQTAHQNEEVYYGYNNTFSQRGKQSNQYLRPSSHSGYRMRNRGNFQKQSFRGCNFTRGSQSQYAQSNRRNAKNPLDEYGQYTRCSICESIFHWATAYPYRKAGAGEIHHHVTLFQSNLIDQDCTKVFVSESLSTAVLDSVATSTVDGKTWMDCYIDSLSEANQTKISYSKSQNMFQFGSGDPVKLLHKVKIPASIRNQDKFIESDVVDNDIPMLLSKSAMKMANTSIDFQSDH